MQALENYLNAKKERDKCYRDVESSPGYFCYSYDNDVSAAAQDIKKYLVEVIKEVNEQISKEE
jgi:hypothetical protein